MAFKKIEVTLASAVASAGTFTATYPTGYTAGSFAVHGHSMFCRGLQTMFKQDDGQMSVSFGATEATITYSGSTSIPASTLVDVQLNQAGPDNKEIPDISKMEGMNIVTPVFIDLGAPKAVDTDAIAESQTVTGAGTAFVLDGVQSDLYGGANVKLDVPRALSASWTTTAILTITGKDVYGDVMIETSASGTSHTGKKAFAEITSIKTSTTITSAVVGILDVLGLPVYVDKVSRIVAETRDGVKITGFSGTAVTVPFVFDQTDLLAPTAQHLVAPVAGYITGIRGIVQAAVTTGGAITVEANTVAVVGLSVTVADAAAAGTVHTDDVLKITTGLVAAGDDITVTPAAAFATAGRYQGYIIIKPVAGLDGTFVAGVQTAPTGTTGDVRGTYDPSEAANGTSSFGLVALVPDPTYKGVDNYDG